MDTKERILASALFLFNRDGAYAVTTRHISEEMGISPGNLYYHYSNREEIIRTLVMRMTDEFSALYSFDSVQSELSGAIESILRHTAAIMYRYRFFYMEPAALLERDPQLKNTYIKIKTGRMNDFRKIVQFMTGAGIILSNITPGELDALFENVWTLNEFIIQSMYMNNEKLTESNLKKKFIKIMYLIRPYISEEYSAKLFPVNN